MKMKTKEAYVVWITLYSMYFNVSSTNLKEKKRNLEIQHTSYLSCLLTIDLLTVGAIELLEL